MKGLWIGMVLIGLGILLMMPKALVSLTNIL
jgi:hypothetical protein